MKLSRTSQGFTLIELMVVIAIIAILSVGGILTYTSQMAKARDSRRLSDITSLQSAIEQYYQDNSAYPTPTAGASTVAGSFDASLIKYTAKIPYDVNYDKLDSNKRQGTEYFDYSYAAPATAPAYYQISSALESSTSLTSKAETTIELGFALSCGGGACVANTAGNRFVVGTPQTSGVTTTYVNDVSTVATYYCGVTGANAGGAKNAGVLAGVAGSTQLLICG